jgi:hypothetical protein
MGLIIDCMSFLEMEVAIKGYSIVFIIVWFTKYHASVGLMRFVLTASAHFRALAFK